MQERFFIDVARRLAIFSASDEEVKITTEGGTDKCTKQYFEAKTAVLLFCTNCTSTSEATIGCFSCCNGNSWVERSTLDAENVRHISDRSYFAGINCGLYASK